MKAIAVEKLLKGIYNSFLETIKDETLREDIRENSFITGGCIPSMLSGEWVNDYDLYFTNSTTVVEVKKYFNSFINEQEGKGNLTKDIGTGHIKITYNVDVKKNSFLPVFITENAINLTDKLQLVTKYYGKPEEVVKNFDWAHIKSYFKYPKLYLDPDVYRLITEKDLVYTGSEYPLSSMMRMQKYIKKGWKITALDQMKIALEMAKLDLTNLEVLREQMAGIDPLYMIGILDQIENKKWTIEELLEEVNRLTNC